MKRKGQALIEALAALSVCVFFFAAWFRLFAGFIKDLKTEALIQEIQLCKLSGRTDCESGFVLVSALLYAALTVFAGHILLSLIVAGNFRWQALNLCFDESLRGLEKPPSAIADRLAKLQNEANQEARGVLSIESHVSEPASLLEKNLQKISYELNWIQRFSPRLFIFKSDSLSDPLAKYLTVTYTCGAQRACNDEKCIYTLIADK